jgi:hypothetical protein
MKPIYLKSTGILSGTFVKLTSDGALHIFEGNISISSFDDMDDFNFRLKMYMKDNYIIATQQEFDEALIKEVTIINNLSAL